MGFGGPARWWLLGGGVVVGLWFALSSPAVPTSPAPERPSPAADERPEPDEATVLARKRRALVGLLARREESRAVSIVVLDCHRTRAAHAEVEILAGDAHISGLTDEAGGFRADIPLSAVSVRVLARVVGDDPIEHRGEVAVAGPAAVGADAGGTAGDEQDEGQRARRPTPPIEVSVCPGATVVGVVRDEAGHPLAGATVRLGEDLTVTEADGEFVLTDLWLDVRRLAVEHAIGATSRDVAPLAAGEERRMDITLESGRRVAGRVVGAADRGVAVIPVSARDANGVVRDTVFTDSQGRFWLKRLPSIPLWIRAVDGVGGIAEVAVAATGANESLVLRLVAQGLLIAHWDGAPGAELVAVPGYAPWESPNPPGDDSRSIVVASGSETLVTAPRFWRVQWVRGDTQGACGEGLVPPGGRLEVRCGAVGKATLTVRVVDEDGRPTTGRWNVRVQDALDAAGLGGELDASGRLTTTVALAHGTTAELRIQAPGHARIDRRAIALSPGTVTDLGTLTMLSGASVSARFPGEARTPFGGIGARVEATELGIALTAIARGGPLDAAGIIAGDVIIAVDGVAAGMLPTFEAVKLMRGTPGSSLHLKLLRGDSGLLDIEVHRALVDAEKAEWVD